MDMADLPGHVVAPNISPDPEAGAATWTDDQLARAIREGIGHDGRALFPMMPYEDFRQMSDEDVGSIVVYLRSLPAVHNHLSKTEIIFPGEIFDSQRTRTFNRASGCSRSCRSGKVRPIPGENRWLRQLSHAAR